MRAPRRMRTREEESLGEAFYLILARITVRLRP